MSNLILIIGDPGTGKTTSVRDLPENETVIINVVGKALPFPNSYKIGENNLVISDSVAIQQKLLEIDKQRPNVKHIVIDDVQYIMAIEFMQKAFVKGYDKFSSMARNIWDILILGNRLRGDLKVYMLCHADEIEGVRMMKTLGRLLREKLTPEGLATIVLFADVIGNDDGTSGTYFFLTQNDGRSIAKSPIGMFPIYIPNSLKIVSDRIDEYYNGIKLEESKINFGEIVRKKK